MSVREKLSMTCAASPNNVPLNNEISVPQSTPHCYVQLLLTSPKMFKIEGVPAKGRKS